MKTPLALLAAGLMMAAPVAMAAQTCTPEQLEALDESKGLFGPLSSPVCKALPNKPELTLASFYVWTGGGKVGDRTYQWNTVVLDSNTNEIMARYRSDIVEGTKIKVRPDSIWLDTANYALNDQVRAVGVRLNIGRKAECAKEYRGQFLTLFVYQNHILTPVLEKLPMAYSRVHWGKDCGKRQKWEKEVGKAHLELRSSKHSGFADIRLKTKGELKLQPQRAYGAKSRSHSYTLEYDGERYRFYAPDLPGYRWTDRKDWD